MALGNYPSYKEDLKLRKGIDADQPHRIAYKRLCERSAITHHLSPPMLTDFKLFIIGATSSTGHRGRHWCGLRGRGESLVDDGRDPPIGSWGNVDFSNLYLLLKDGTTRPLRIARESKAAGAARSTTDSLSTP